MLAGCLIGVVLGLVGLVGCVSFIVASEDAYDRDHIHGYAYDLEHDDDHGRFGYDGTNAQDDADGYDDAVFSRREIEEAAGNLPNDHDGNRCLAGTFEVGAGKDLDPGMYFLEGSASAESAYYLFEYDDDLDGYTLDVSVAYFGNYFVELEDGDLIVFQPEGAQHMMPVAEASFEPSAPYGPGLYRVGTDMPAGTYTVVVSDDAPADASQGCAAYVMKDLEFDEDSITDACYLLKGGTQRIAVKDGDYLELYAAVATPDDQAETD